MLHRFTPRAPVELVLGGPAADPAVEAGPDDRGSL
jgi:hypothetical protein